MKPSLKFLQKVRDGHVRHICSYSANLGTRYYWRGGEKTAKKYAAAGYVTIPSAGPSLGRPAVVTLTKLGESTRLELHAGRG
jgi:hypothetical protein